jgi:3-hydroxybutyryl-CoA dehydrogenase
VETLDAVRKVGVVGAGLMGAGIAQVAAQAGYQTVVREINDELLNKGLQRVRDTLEGGIKRGKVTSEQMSEALGRLKGTTALEDLRDCDLIVEAIVEEIAEKKRLYAALDALCPPETIFLSNTSSLTIIEMAAATKRADRFAGCHFFNPVPLMPLVEVVRSIATSEETIETTRRWAESLGKTVILARDSTGFIVNRLLVPYLLDAIRAYEAGAGSLEDIDQGMRLGAGYPIGPFALLDLIGLDTIYHIANIMFDEFKEQRMAPPPLLRRMVLAGQLGRKSGKGFYDYANK